jgi:hypothetical protein
MDRILLKTREDASPSRNDWRVSNIGTNLIGGASVMLFGRPDSFGSRHSARIYLEEEHLAVMRDQRSEAAIHVIKDRFSLKSIPIVYYNAKFGVPLQADQTALARWRKVDFQAVTEFQLHARGIELDDTQLEGFLRGDWIAYVPAHDDEGRAGNPGHGTIAGILRTALHAHCVRANRVLQMAKFRSERDKNPRTRFNAAFRDRLKDSEFAEVEQTFRDVSDLYDVREVLEDRDVGLDHVSTSGRSAVVEWFGLTPTAIRSHAAAEILCYEQIYGTFSYKAVVDRELPLISALRRAHLRALTVYGIARRAAKHQIAHGKPMSHDTKEQLDFGKEFDLNLWGCFIVALHGGVNPASLYGEFEELADLFDLAVWFGYFARGHYDELPPEIAVTLAKCLSSNPGYAVNVSNVSDLEKIYGEVRYLADLLIGEEDLREKAQRAIAARTAVQVAPLYYNVVIGPSATKPDSAEAHIDPRFKIGKGQEGVILAVDHEKFPQIIEGEKLFIRRFRPLLW